MSKIFLPACAGLFLASTAFFPALADEKCAPDQLSATVDQRMQADNKSPSDIAGILDSGFKRGILAGRIKDGSPCSEDQVNAALDVLAKKYK